MLTLNRPEMSVPTLSKPEASDPELPIPESPPSNSPAAWWNQPDEAEPKFPKPDPPPPPVLKNPDDGRVVEFPKPGVAGISIIEMSIGPALVKMSKSSGIGSIVVPGIMTAGISTDKSIGNTSDIEIPSIVEAGISIGISIGMDSLNEIASRAMGSVIRSSGILIPSMFIFPRLKGDILPDCWPTSGRTKLTLVTAGTKMGPTTIGLNPIVPALNVESKVVAGAVKPTLAAPSKPMRMAGMGISGTAKE